jgi:hypothetical protein
MKPSELCAEALHKAGVAADLDLSALAYMIAEHSRCDDYAYAMAVDALVHWRHGEYDISLTWAKRVADLIIRAEGGHWEPHDWEGISEPGAPEQTAKCRGCGKILANAVKGAKTQEGESG